MMHEQLPLLGGRRGGHGLVLALLALGVATLLGVAVLVQQQNAVLAELRGRSALSPAAFSVSASRSPGSSSGSSNGTNVLVVYASGPHLEQLASAVEEGARRVDGTQVRTRTVEQASFRDDVLWADAVVLGSHVMNANVEPKVVEFLKSWSLAEDLSDKVGAVFVTGGGISAGEELTMVNLLHSLMIFRLVIVGGEHWTSAFGASAVVGEGPFEPMAKNRPEDRDFPSICYPTDPNAVAVMFRNKAVGLGERVASVAARLMATAA